MKRSLLAGLLAVAIAACTGGAPKDAPQQGAATDRPAGGSAGGAAAERSLASGTRIEAVIENALSSRTNKPGETFRATVRGDVKDAGGAVVVPAGAIVTLTIDKLEPGSEQVRPEGRLSLVVNSIAVNGQDYPVTATLDPVTHHMQGRGITTDEAARIGAGTAIGAAAGQMIGKNTKGTVIGGAVGAVTGGAVAVRYAYRDVIVSAGTPIAFTLTQVLHVSAR